MDFERAKIKALFYDYPVEHAVKVIREGDAGYLDEFSHVARWREQAFSLTEMEALKRQIASEYEKDNAENLLKMLLDVSLEFLTMGDIGEPIVEYDNLLRWQDIISLVGEDLLVAPFVAQNDVEHHSERTVFLWPDILHHNGNRINTILDKGLTDVHAHFHATVDVFALNWISMMNGGAMTELEKINELKLKAYQERIIPIAHQESHPLEVYSWMNMVVAAAYIRVRLWRLLNGYDITTDLSIDEIEKIFKDKSKSADIYEIVKKESEELGTMALRDSGHAVLDYMIQDGSISDTEKDNPFLVYSGERGLVYQLYKVLLTEPEKIREYLPMVYLYMLIKSKVRSYFVQNNHLVGFENFQLYQKWKSAAISLSPIHKHYAQLVLQTTIRAEKDDHLEGRFYLFDDKSIERQYIQMFKECNKGIVSGEEICPIDKLSLVYHFIKSDDYSEGLFGDIKYVSNAIRHASFRQKIQTACDTVVQLYEDQRYYQSESGINVPRLTGIDAAGNELYCRPEVFAHVYRYCREKGIVNQTYHVGEDFLDLVDGLRAIDEAIRFLELDDRCRLGHALALGTDAFKYYECRHYHSLLPQQSYLDNCVWLIKMGENISQEAMTDDMKQRLLNIAQTMYAEIGYGKEMSFKLDSYWHSMLMRGTDIDSIYDTTKPLTSEWQIAAIQHSDEIQRALKDEDGVAIYELYHRSENVKRNGIEVVDVKWDNSIVPIVDQIQCHERKMIVERGIAIECNPTSNYKIGRFDRYDELPLFLFNQLDTGQTNTNICTSINTDDRGVFMTSIEREYSLVSLAMKKKKNQLKTRMYDDNQIEDYMEQMRQNGVSQCFKLNI